MLTHVFLLFVDMADLEPDVLFTEWPWRIADNVFEALSIVSVRVKSKTRSATNLKTLLVFVLLLVYDAQAEVDLIGLLKVGLHAHDLGEGFLCMIKRPIAVIEYTYAVPQFGLLCRVSI